MPSKLPAVTGYQLIAHLEKGGWTTGRKANHGRTMTKSDGGCIRVTFIPETRASLPKGTLGAILGPKQTGIGKEGLQKLIRKK
jgi:predicted RNA binding protein YcfA (HicA-like mRNA interferase family)